MKKELGKWLMDISKYIVTGVLLTSLISDLEKWAVFVLAFLVGAVFLGFGLYAIKSSERDDSDNENENEN